MAKSIQSPAPGQPLDVVFLGEIVSTVNTLITEVASSKGKDSTVKDQTAKTSELKIFATTKTISNPAVTAGGSQGFEIPMSGFKYTPVISVTPVSTSAAFDVSVSISSVTSSTITGIVKFGSSGVVSTDINIIAIGISN